MSKKYTTEEFIEKARQVHGNKYDYSKVNYQGCYQKVKIICPDHGPFWQTPAKHLSGQKCPKCSKVFRYNTKQWKEEAGKKHNHKYDYSKVIYKGNKEKVKIICPIHGIFEQQAGNHMHGQGCPECANMQMRIDRQWSKDHFVEEAMSIHDNKYDYSKVNYINQNTKVTIICPIHGEFEQFPSAHLRGCGCPKCKGSKGEKQVNAYLDSHSILFEREYNIIAPKEIRETGICRIDFYLPEYNAFIEYNGIQHYQSHPYFGGEEGFLKQQQRDEYVRKYCKEYNIHLLEIKYTDDVNMSIEEFLLNVSGKND